MVLLNLKILENDEILIGNVVKSKYKVVKEVYTQEIINILDKMKERSINEITIDRDIKDIFKNL